MDNGDFMETCKSYKVSLSELATNYQTPAVSKFEMRDGSSGRF